MGSRCQNRVGRRLAPHRRAFPDGELQKIREKGRGELLDGAVGLVRNDGKTKPLLLQSVHHRKDSVIGSGLDEAVGIIPGLVEREDLRLQLGAAVRRDAVLYQISSSVAEALTHMRLRDRRQREFREGTVDGVIEIVQGVQDSPVHVEKNGLIFHQIRMPRFFASKFSSSRKSGWAMEISCFTREERV